MAAAPALPDELVEEALVRVPLDDPARLLCAALVCKPWGRLISDPRFRRRYRDLHPTPPVLGYLSTRGYIPPTARFVSTSSFRPPRAVWPGCEAVDARHGRVLLHSRPGKDDPQPNVLLVWDPVTDQQREIPALPWRPDPAAWKAAVLCAAAGDGCDHLDCHHSGPLLVVFVATLRDQAAACIYSSEADAWVETTTMPKPEDWFSGFTHALAGNALYFRYHLGTALLKYDLTTRQMCTVHLPVEADVCGRNIELIAMEGGRLGFASNNNSGIFLWSREVGPDADAQWAQIRVIEREKLLPDGVSSVVVSCYVDGAEIIFTYTVGYRLFMVDLKSSSGKGLY